MPDHPTASWQAMQDGNVFYRRQQLYSVAGKFPDFGDHITAGCRYGGPLAMMRDNTKLIALGRPTPTVAKAQIQVWSPAGTGLLVFSWDQGKIVRFGWTGDERLVVVNEEGVYRVYDLQGDYQQYSLGTDAAEMGVLDARIHDNGLVALTGALTLLEVKGWQGARPLGLANAGLAQPPHSWAIIPPDLNISRHIEVLLSSDTTICTVDTLECIDQRLSQGPFTHISPSPNGKTLAILTFSGSLLVISTDFQRHITEYDTGSINADGPVRQVEWCGNDAILVTWNALTVLVGPFADTLEFFYGGQMFAVTEPDGVRVMGPDVCDLIQKVPASVLSIFRPGSTTPASILYDAWQSFSERSPKSDEGIRSIRPDLSAAVDQCIDAAGREWEPYWQRSLLNAAKFGRGFLDLYNPNEFISMGQTLKVLNAVRFYEIGIPLTYDQYQYAFPSSLVERLTSRNMHLLALRISEFLGMKPDAVLKHWASAKILKSKSSSTADGDEQVCALIVDKFKQIGGAVSYSEIAKRAWEVGRAGLATRLLDHEANASDQVPLLLTMKEDRLALEKAVDSGDTDLVYTVLLHLHQRLALGTFFKLLEEGGERLVPASRLLQVYAREMDRGMLRDFYYSDDRRVESAVLALGDGGTDVEAKITSVKGAHKFFSEDKERVFEAKMMDEYARLLAAQQQLEKETDGKVAFVGLGLAQTMRACFMNGLGKRGDKLRGDFKVDDKRFWYLKLQALIDLRDFEGIDALAKAKRSPIGYEPFVKRLIRAGHAKEASTYVVRCDSPRRADLYAECGEWRMAGKECKERGDKAKLDELRKRCPDSLVQRELDQIAGGMK